MAIKGSKLSDETKQKMREAKLGSKNPMFKKEFSFEHKKHLSEANKGRKHSIESKSNMSKAHKGKKFSEEHKQKLHQSRSTETKQKMCEAKLGKPSNNLGYLGKKRTEETKSKMREFWKLNNKTSAWCVGYHNGIPYQSSYELNFMKLLDEYKIPYERADNKKFRVKYIFENKEHYYYPDFYLPRENSIVEIKSSYNLKQTQTQIKLEAAKKLYGKKFIIITEQEIPELKKNYV